jgi:hypothetical protein
MEHSDRAKKHGHAAWTRSMDMQHGDMDMEHVYEAWICSIGIENGNAKWTCMTDKQHG